MTSSVLLKREVAAAARRLMIVLQFSRKVARLRGENSEDESLPTVEECRREIGSRCAVYVAVLSRYRRSLEQALEGARKPAARVRTTSSTKRRYRKWVPEAARASKHALSSRPQRRG